MSKLKPPALSAWLPQQKQGLQQPALNLTPELQGFKTPVVQPVSIAGAYKQFSGYGGNTDGPYRQQEEADPQQSPYDEAGNMRPASLMDMLIRANGRYRQPTNDARRQSKQQPTLASYLAGGYS